MNSLDGAALAAAYIESIRYHRGIGRLSAPICPADALLLVLGDHQPPAIVGGREIPWQVPVHVFSAIRRCWSDGWRRDFVRE